MNIAIVGCGLIGEKRAKALDERHKIIITADLDIKRAEKVAQINGNNGIAVKDWKDAVSHPEVDIVIVATTNNLLTPISITALENNKHVLLEKPGARDSKEIEELVNISQKKHRIVKLGFNHRFHPSFLKLNELIDNNDVGELMFIRGRYGHGGRVGYDKEWRANPEISGGGELLDQGVHLIDLSRMLLGDFLHIDGFTNTYFWDMKVDDNAFLSLRTEKDQMAWLHVSCSEWKNMFCFEVYYKKAKFQIDGLGGSYGTERLTYYKMLPEMGPPETMMWEFPGADKSWGKEFDSFVDSIEKDSPVWGGINDAYEALKIVDKISGKV